MLQQALIYTAEQATSHFSRDYISYVAVCSSLTAGHKLQISEWNDDGLKIYN
jgi:hypothetical protein